MTKIRNTRAYPRDVVISDQDYIIGSDGDTIEKQTKNYYFSDIRNYLLEGLAPEVGGTLKISEIKDNSGDYENPEDLANSLNPSYIVLQYHVVIFVVNGNRFLLNKQNISIGFVEDALTNDDFITLSSLESVGDGVSIYDGFNETSESNEFKSIKSISDIVSIIANGQVIEVSIDEEALNEAVNISNVGEGSEIYKGYNPTTESHEFRKIKSSTLSVMLSEDEETLEIETPSTASIPALYVNNLYLPTEEEFLAGNTKGEGTLAKPFTDTVTAYVAGVPTITPNTAIQNALDAYVGDTLTYSRINPEKSGQQIVVQNNNTGYIFNGDFGYSNLNLKIEANVTSTYTGYVIDMDNPLHFNNAQDSIKITIEEGYRLFIQGEGFKNNGTTTATNNYTLKRQCILQGGIINFTGNDINKYLLTSDKDSVGNGTTGFINDGSWQFEVRCYLESEFQGLVAIGGKSNILNIGATYQTGSVSNDVDVNLKAFYQKGGSLSFRGNSSVIIYGSNTTTRLKGFVFEPTNGFLVTFDQDNCSMVGNVGILYSKENSNDVSFIVSESGSGLNMYTNDIFYSPNLWNVIFRNNIFALGDIDFSMVDLTQGNSMSVINTIGANIVESLRYYNSKASAKSAGLPTNSAFLKRVTVSAGNFEIGTEYRILTSGTPSIGTVGDYFTAVDNGSTYVGATAYLETREILI